MFDQAVARLRGVREDMRAASVEATQMRDWMDAIDQSIGDLLEVERRARYREVFALGAALVDVTLDLSPGSVCAQADGPPDCQAVNRERQASVVT